MAGNINNLAKRGKKGGTRFPNYSLKQVLPFLKDLLSKTHSKPINIEQLNAGVFKLNAKSPDGNVKYSSLKQFGLAEGEYSSITSKDLASNIALSSEGEKVKFLREAFLNVPTFKSTFETYQDSTVNKNKIKGYCVSTLKVHFDLSDKFLKSFLESAEVATLCTINSDDVKFISGKNVLINEENKIEDEDEEGNIEIEEQEDSQELGINNDVNNENNDENSKSTHNNVKLKNNKPNIELKIDPTLDPDKLEKQLKVLRKFNLI